MWNTARYQLASSTPLSAALVGTVVEINLSHSGLATTNSSLSYYVREESVRLWEFLETSEDRVLAVFGTPGGGKSVDVFYYAMHVAREKVSESSTFILIIIKLTLESSLKMMLTLTAIVILRNITMHNLNIYLILLCLILMLGW